MSTSSTKYNSKWSEQNTINNDIPTNIEVSYLNNDADNKSNSLSGSIIHDTSSTSHATLKNNQFQQYYDEFLSTNNKSVTNRSHTLFDNDNNTSFLDTNHHKRTNNTGLDDFHSTSQQTNDSKRAKSSNNEVWQKYENVLLEDILDEDYEPENKRTNAILLNIKVNDSIKNKSVSTYSFKTQKTQANTDISYDRIFLFGSLCTNKCFVIISTTKRNSARILSKFTDASYTVGQTLVILEPVYQGKTLGKDGNLPILEVQKTFEPFNFSWISQVPYHEPEEVTTTYFYLKGACIKISLAEMQKSNCSGTLCDRQKNDKSCSCLYKSGRGQLVIDCWVKILDTDNNIILEMQNFRSWNFTKLILDKVNASMIVDDFKDEAEVKLRTCIKNIVSYCNRRGGWNISGWMRRGHQIDPVDTPNKGEQITAETISPHIIKLSPTNVSKDDLRKENLLYSQNTLYLSLE